MSRVRIANRDRYGGQMGELLIRPRAAPSAPGLESFSTQTVAEPKRVEYWNALSCNTFTGVEVVPCRDLPFSASLRRLIMDDICVAEIRSAASTVRHTSEHIGRLQDSPAFLLHLQLSGISVTTQAGRETTLRSGDATLCDTTRPWSVKFGADAQFFVCRLPNPEVRRRLHDIEDVVGRHLACNSGGLGLVSSFLQNLLAQAHLGPTSGWLDELGPIVLDMVVMTCRSAVPHPQSDPRRSRHRSVLQYVDENLGNPGLSVHFVAQQFGLGARSIQRMFAAQGTTLGAYVLKQRLKAAANRLAESGSDGVTEIALAAGFNDLSYFGRVFRRSFGVSPREYRRARCRRP